MTICYYEASDYFKERSYPGEPIVEETDFIDAESFGKAGEAEDTFDEDHFWESLGNN